MRKKTPTDYHALASKHGLRWLGPEVRNTQTKTTWECKQGHQWESRYSQIYQGYGCPVCAGKLPKTPTDYRALAKKRGFYWIGPVVANTMTKTGWQCEKGHQWQAPYNALHNGTGCPNCATKRRAARRRTGPEYYQALAERRGFRWLGPVVPSVHARTGWECSQGHRWQAAYSNVNRGSGCPVCARNRYKKSPDASRPAQKRSTRSSEARVSAVQPY